MSAQTEYVAEKRRLIENLEAELEHMNELKSSAEAEDARLHQVLDHISASEMKIDQLMNN